MKVVKKYKPEHDKWLITHIDDCEYPELAERFNSLYNMAVSGEALRHRAYRIGISKTYNSSHVRKGELMREDIALPIGSERITDGIVWVKVADERGQYNKKCSGGYSNGHNWRKKAYINWEKEYGEIPKGKRVVYLDGDSTHCEAENLYFTTVAIQMHISRHGIILENRDLTLALIKWYELSNAIKNTKEN